MDATTERASVMAVVTRRFDASAERVFDAWLDPAQIRQWFGPGLGEMTRVETDPRAGGTFWIEQRRPEGDAPHTGEYLQIVRPRQLVFTWRTPPVEDTSTVRVYITRLAGGCEVSVMHEIPAVWKDYLPRVEAGWNAMLGEMHRITAGAPSVVVVRTIAASADRVFAAWTDPQKLRAWMAPGPLEVVEAITDPRPGGRYRIVVADPSGGRHVTTGEYREVLPGRRLVKTWIYEGPNPVESAETLLTVELRDTGTGTTELTIRQDGLATPRDRAGNHEGWNLCLDRLEALAGDASGHDVEGRKP
ncbi:MAG: SRPBCC family protein [Vicinamibacterales bacterium]